MKKFKKKAIGTIVAMSLLSSVTSAETEKNGPRNALDKPNIILMFLDDAGYADLKSNGGKYPTKNLDKMADEGQRWTDFYVSSPICSPSRAGLLTGRLGVRNGMYGKNIGVLMEMDKDGMPSSEVTIAEMLKDNGYNTAMLGKWHLGEHEEHLPTRHGFDQSYGALVSNDMYWTEEYGTVQDIMKAYSNKDWKEFNRIMKVHDKAVVVPKEEMWNVPVLNSYMNADGSYNDNYTTMIQTTFTQNITKRATHYITKNKDEPFFLYMAYPQNHVPLFVSPEFEGKTDSAYGDVMQEIDWSVGTIMDQLKEQGIDKNTIVILASDNGPWDKPGYVAAGHAADSGKLAGGKNRTLEGGVRTPTLIHWSGQIEPAVINGIGSTLDILPTLATLTDSKLPKATLDGIDLTDTLLYGKESPRKIHPYYLEGRLEAFRSGDWKIHLLSYSENQGYGAKPKDNGSVELYNLRNDISESTNVASEYPDIVQRLLKEVSNYKSFVGTHAAPMFDLP